MRTQSLYFPALFNSLLDEPVYSTTHSHVEENEQSYFIQIDAPGIRKEDLKISVENRQLVIEGERKGKLPRKLRRAFSLPEDVDLENVDAQLKDGVLELGLPKKEQARPKLIPIRNASDEPKTS